MESPVRICLGAAVVVNLLLLCSTTVRAVALPPQSTNTTTIKDEKTISSRYSKVNGTTWVPRGRTRNIDTALNELNPNESVSEEHIDAKNAKYKDRGRIKFNSNHQSSTSTVTPRRIVRTSTQGPKFTIVTPTPEKKHVSQIIDSMREYKNTKIPVTVSSTTPINEEQNESGNDEDEDDYEDDVEENEKNDDRPESFHEPSNFFTIPGFDNDEDFSLDSQKENSVPKKYNVPSYDKYSSYFTSDNDFSPTSDFYQSDDFFKDFEDSLTTPRNDYFDKRFKEISNGIMKNLATIKTQTPKPTLTNVLKMTDDYGIGKGTPANKSTVYFKNTKEISLSDNDKAGTDKKELSDVQGTSIYYEMSVLSTETYSLDNSNEDDCDNDTILNEPTPSTTSDEENASIKETQDNIIYLPTKYYSNNSILSSSNSVIVASTTTPAPITPVFTTPAPTDPTTTESEKSTQKSYSSSYRNRVYPKRINFTNNKEYPNSVTAKISNANSSQGFKTVTRRFQYTTPKTKPIWMAPRRNYTYSKTTYPTTIYAEHFNIKDRIPKIRNKTASSVLTTVSSDIDPILQSDVGSNKKVVHSHTISDNSIPQLSKRGSVKYSSSTTTSVEEEHETEKDFMEIPPTLTAWALAGLRAPPSISNQIVNNTGTPQKTIDVNELQDVGEVSENIETTTSSTTLMTPSNAEFTKNNIFDVDQNKLPWKPGYAEASDTEVNESASTTETKSERLPAESNISIQSSAQPNTKALDDDSSHVADTTKNVSTNEVTTETVSWIKVNKTEIEEITTEHSVSAFTVKEKLTPTEGKSTAFESITKLPSGVTTPQDDVNQVSILESTLREIQTETTETTPSTTQTTPKLDDFEITTIRFTYIPTILDDVTESTEPTTTDTWHPVSDDITIITTIEDAPITTYRPKYITTSDDIEEVTTTFPETTTQVNELNTEAITTTTISETSTATDKISTESEIVTLKPELETTTEVEIVTEINTEIEISIATSRPLKKHTTDTPTSLPSSSVNPIASSSEENSGSNEVITHMKETTTTETTTSTEQEENMTTLLSTELEALTEYKPEPTERPDDVTDKSTEIPKESTTAYQEYIKSTSEMISTKVELVTTKQDLITTKQDLITIKEEPISSEEEPITSKEAPITESTTDSLTTRSINDLEDVSSYGGDMMTTEASSRVVGDAEPGSGAAVAIAVSTIGVIALILLIGLLLVVRKRGRRGIYAQRCTPVSLDAYSLDSVSVGQRKGHQRLRASKRSYGNPAYDDEVTSHPMQYAALANFALDTESMTAEFAEIPSVTVRPDEVPPGCEDKNRYSNVLPLPDTRVSLQRLGNDPTTEYINANYITGPGNIRNYYIACQAPLSNTVADFWRMIWEQNSRLVVMLTEYMENGVEKCYEYLPPSEISDNKRTFGDYQIILQKREQRDKYAVSSVQLINRVTRTWREVTHLWYFWPAKGVPDNYDSIIDFLSEMRSYMKASQTAKEYDEQGVEVIYGANSRASFQNLSKLKSDDNSSGNGVNVYSPQRAEEHLRRSGITNGTLSRMKAASEIEGVRPCVVTCASGSGRSCALVALDVSSRALSAGAVDVPRVVRQLRAQRPHALANRQHYILLYKVLSEYGNKLMGGGNDGI